MRSTISGLDRRLTTTVQRISPGPDGTFIADAGSLANAPAVARAKSREGRVFMFASPDVAAASTPLTNMSQGWHGDRAASPASKVAFAGLFDGAYGILPSC